MTVTIPASSITIDGPRAWWVVPEDELPQIPHLPCDNCFGRGWGRNLFADVDTQCPECYGTGRHTFEIHVEDLEAAPIHIGPRMTTTYRVHVVRVLPIVDPPPNKYPTHDFVRYPAHPARYEWTGAPGIHSWKCHGGVELPADAEPGKYVVEMEIHS
jgi:hypothetical protein